MDSQAGIYEIYWERYFDLGLIPYPADPGIKGTYISWQKDFPPEKVTKELCQEWAKKFPDHGIWVFIGSKVVIEPDDPRAEEYVKSLNLPSCPTCISGGKSIHRWFNLSSPVEAIKIQNGSDKTFLEVRTGRMGMMAPPSIHPETKKAYRWAEGLSPWDIPFPELPLEAYQRIKGLMGNDGRKEPLRSLYGGVEKGARNDTLARLCGSWARDGLNFQECMEQARTWNQLNSPPLPDREIETTVKSIFEKHHREKSQEKDFSIEVGINLTDLGNARRFVIVHGPDLRFCFPWGKWLAWDGQRWKIDDTGEIYRRAKDTIRLIYEEAAAANDEKQRKQLASHALRSESDSKIKAMLSMAQSEPGIHILPDDLDKNPWALNVASGTIDLKTGFLKPHRREDLITRMAPVQYRPDALCPFWLEHLRKIFQGNVGLISFVQVAAGYSLTGITDERAMFISHGTGANGKSTTHEVIAQMLGDYAVRTPTESILVKREGGIPNDLAALKGARFVFCSELEEGKRLAESLVKDLTGNDTISARFMRGEWFTFQPSFKLWLATNHKPIIRGTDNAIWSRIRLIPFTVQIPESDRIPRSRMMERLTPELPGILSWAVLGCADWVHYGLGMPDEVKEATEGYRGEMDILGGFINECCVVSENAQGTAKELYETYVKWAESNGEKSVSQRMFGLRLAERGFRQGRMTGGRIQWKGIGLESVLPLTP